MASFKDRTETPWLVDINTNALKRIKTATGVDLANDAAKWVDRMSADPVLLVDVLWALLEPQAKDVSQEQFAERLTGDAIERAADALVEGLIDFFPKSRRELLKAIAEKARGAADRAAKLAMEKMPLLDSYLDAELAKLDAELTSQLTFGSKSTGSPASSELTPAP